jgi:hypothetical protein
VKFTDFYESYKFLDGHPKFIGSLQESLIVEVVKVNPENLTIEEDESKNTLVQVWLECGPYEFIGETNAYENTHDTDLDTGADTFEQAIIKLAELVHKHYGPYTAEDQERAYKKWHDWVVKGHR